MKIVIIVAVAKNKVIGCNGKIPWHSKEDFRHFKETTMGFPVIMGRKTFESIGKPLPNRLNIVISRKTNNSSENLLYFTSLQDGIEYCEKLNYDKSFVIGGAELYRQTIGIANEIILSEMPFEPDGDTFFPNLDENEWLEAERKQMETFEIIKYLRK